MQVRSVIKKGMRWDKRFEAVRLRKAALEKACEKKLGAGFVCRVKAMNGGVRYYQSAYLRVRDVRLVYAPPKALGKFGGDIDNWMYPRHTADFSFLRAYVGPRGRAAAYAKGNRPLGTPLHLKVSRWGVKRGSLTLVIGFPGRTSRHVTSHAVRAAPELADVPVNFTATLDTTGGNSGSPVLDDKGRLVGLLFDGTPESILSDWQYLQQEQRSICVDMRYVMWLARVQRASYVLREISLAMQGPSQRRAPQRAAK